MSQGQAVDRAKSNGALAIFVTSAVYWGATNLIVISGIVFGVGFLQKQPLPRTTSPHIANPLTHWDAVWYARIMRQGYQCDSDSRSNVAFFPAHPLISMGVAKLTGFPPEFALVVSSQVSLFGALVVLVAFTKARCNAFESRASLILMAMVFWPTTFFFRMAYAESLCLLTLLLAMLGMQRGWRPWVVAILAGLSTATRPVGVAIVPVFLLWLWQESRTGTDAAEISSRQRLRRVAWQSVWLLPLACWGILAFMAYQQVAFGDALAFLKTQKHWAVRSTPDFWTHVKALVTLEPIWSVYVPSSVAWWGRHEAHANPLFSLQFMNPIYFTTAAALLGLGAWKKWLNGREILLGVLLLGIPYVSHSYRAVMMGHGRYAALVFPAYIVLGQLLRRCPPPLAAMLCGVSAFFLGAYSALFAAWYRMI